MLSKSEALKRSVRLKRRVKMDERIAEVWEVWDGV